MSIIFLHDKIYIPQDLVVDKTLLTKNWEFPVFEETLCRTCENKPNRVNSQCRTCPGLTKIIKMWGERQGNNGVNYYTVPAGNVSESLRKLKIDLNFSKVVDKRCNVPFSNDLKFTGELRTGQEVNGIATANQQYLVDKWLEVGHGLIEAPPRTGKTVIGTYLSCFLQRKTLITAHQEELLTNFYKTYETMTNLLELRESTGKQIVKIINKIEDLDKEDYDVILVNYQKFIRKETSAERISKYLKSKVSFLAVDEIHGGNATCYSKFLNQLAPSYALGLTATVKRKDCVTGDTLIYTEEGVLSIEEVVSRKKRGEELRVYSKNLISNTIELKPILEVHEVEVDTYRELVLKNNLIVKTTLDHLIY